jgi:beta-glucosidase
MAGASYDDERWEKFLDQLTFDEMLELYNNGAFQTSGISRLDVPGTVASDGTMGYVVFMGDPTIYDTCMYCCQMVTACTWNVDRAYDIGVAEGEEGLIGNQRVDGTYYTGLYAPGVNLHRSPFGGRNFEYYSEMLVLQVKWLRHK